MSEWYEEICVKKMSNTIYRITNPTGEHMFLILGESRAALIDTGAGYGDLWKAIRSVTDLPVTLYNTHVHPDHVGGNGFFREAWIPEHDRELIANATSWKGRVGFMKIALPEWREEFETIPHVEVPDDFVWHELKDGDRIDLGGVVLRAIETPGHTKGSMCFLHESEKILFVGDLLGRKTTLLARGGTSVTMFLETLRNLQEMLPEIKELYNSHNEGIVPKEVVWNLLSLSIDILNGKDDKIPILFNRHPGYMAKNMKNALEREDGKFGNLSYDFGKI